MERLGHALSCGLDIGEIGLAVVVERCRYAHDDYVTLFDPCVICRRAETARDDQVTKLGAWHISDVAARGVDAVDPLDFHVEAQCRETCTRRPYCHRQPDVAESDDP